MRGPEEWPSSCSERSERDTESGLQAHPLIYLRPRQSPPRISIPPLPSSRPANQTRVRASLARNAVSQPAPSLFCLMSFQRRIVTGMDRRWHASLDSLRKPSSGEAGHAPEHLVPFGRFGAGQWTSHPVGLVVAVGIVLMVLVGIPEARPFFVIALLFGAILGCVLWLKHRSKGFF